MTTIFLPYPPSANSMWRVFNGRIIKSAAYRKWIAAAGQELMIQRPEAIHGRAQVHFTVDVPDNRRRDGDNIVKPSLDLLVTHGVIDDDCLKMVPYHSVREGELRRGDGRVVVTVENAE